MTRDAKVARTLQQDLDELDAFLHMANRMSPKDCSELIRDYCINRQGNTVVTAIRLTRVAWELL